MSSMRVAAVTGGNKGIGYEIIRGIISKYPKSKLNSGPLLLYLAARDKGRGEAAVEQLHRDESLSQLLRSSVKLKYHELDVAQPNSVQAFAEYMKSEHPDGLDILVNNAGVSLDGQSTQIVHDTLAINYYGAMNMTERLLSHLRKDGRIVNVASMLGKLNKYSPEITAAFKEAAASQAPHSTGYLMQQYQAAVDAGNAEEKGWPSSAYSVSKAGVIGATMFLGKQLQRTTPERGLCINACCPGYVKTDMTKQRGRKTPEDGARTPVHLAIGDIEGVTGEFWEREEVSSW